MSPPAIRILIAENQYLIAMEVERMLAELLACQATIVPLARLDEELAAASYDVVILDAASSDAVNLARVEAIHASGAVPVFLSSYGHFGRTSSVVLRHPTVTKPPLGEQLAAAVQMAANQRQSDGEGLLDNG